MYLINFNMKNATKSLCWFLAFQMLIMACSPSSTTTTKPGSWDRSGDFDGTTRGSAFGFVLNGVPYIGGGYNAGLNARVNDVWRYDSNVGSWVQVADFPGTARSVAAAFTIGNKAYVGTGYDDNRNALSDFWQYDPSVGNGGTWTQIADFGYSATNGTPAIHRFSSTGFSVKDRGFVAFGEDIAQTGYKDIWEYLPATNEWVRRPSLSGSKRWNAFVMVIGDYAYLGGGQDNNFYPTDFWKFDVTQVDGGNPWTQLDALDQRDVNGNPEIEPKSRELASTFTINGFGYLVAGAIGYQLGDTWQYDPSTDNWIEYYSLNSEAQSRSGAIGFSIGANGYIATGSNGSTRLDDVWVFDPTGVEPNYK